MKFVAWQYMLLSTILWISRTAVAVLFRKKHELIMPDMVRQFFAENIHKLQLGRVAAVKYLFAAEKYIDLRIISVTRTARLFSEIAVFIHR